MKIFWPICLIVLNISLCKDQGYGNEQIITMLNQYYKNYSKAIPILGKYVVGSTKPYDYLINSIDSFYNQEQLLKLIAKNGFENLEYRNLSNGISAIHSGWKI